jgi:serine/threonine-protein kinase
MTDTTDHRHWQRVNALLEVALNLPREERDGWLKALPPEDAGLGPKLREMLARSGIESDAFLGRPVAAGVVAAAVDDVIPRDRPGDIVGGYRLESLLGSGGMATVWAAEREEGTLHRRIALKLPRPGWVPGWAARLKRESEILAGLEHPNIARLYDAGVTPEGRPYFAMELIEGEAIDAHCAGRGLGVPERLRLFLQVARALAFAHSRLIVHRDLKPSNILVDAQGIVHVVDFGLAKLLSGTGHTRTHLTEAVGRHLTLAYASPEQVGGDSLTVGTDIYSLGVVLYELLTGSRPYILRRQTPAALEEAIAEAEVPPASSRVQRAALKRALRGDLDTILSKALRKDPAQRYASIEAFAADVQRHLRAEPVLARPDSSLYVAGRFVRRHRVGVAAGALVAVATLLGVAGTVYQSRLAAEQARRAELERDKAVRQLNYAEASEEFLQFLLSEQAAHPLPAAVLLDRAESALVQQYGNQPLVRARLHILLGLNYSRMSEFGKGEAQFREARRLARSAGDFGAEAHADCLLGAMMIPNGQHKAAFELVDATIRKVEAATNVEAVVREACYVERAAMNRQAGNADAAARDANLALEAMGPPRPGQEQKRALLRFAQAYPLIKAGRLGDALAMYDQSRNDIARLGRSNTSLGVQVTSNYYSLLIHAGQLKRADALYNEIVRGISPEDSSGLVSSLAKTRVVQLLRAGRNDEALRLGEEVAPARTALGDIQGAGHVHLWAGLAACADGELDKCDALFQRAEGELKSILTLTHPTTWILETGKAELLLARGDSSAALSLLEPVIARSSVERSPHLVRALSMRALAQQRAGDASAARDSAAKAVEVARSAMVGLEHSEWLGNALLTQARVLRAQGEEAGASAALAEARAQLVGSVGEGTAAVRRARL